MKILIVDDEYSKAEEISKVLTQTGVADYFVKHETSANGARRTLQSENFDLLIIDLHLPALWGEKPYDNGGLEFFDIITLDEKITLPSDILFISGREELLGDANAMVVKRGCVLSQYRSDSDEWKNILTGRVKLLHSRLKHSVPIIDIAIVTALKEPELEAVLNLPYDWKSRRFTGDPLTYHFGTIARSEGCISVVAVSPHKKGMPSSAAIASKLAIKFRPQYLVMLGICAGIPNKCNFGDVIVADPTWDWGSGKRGSNSEGSAVFQAAPYQMKLNSKISQIASDLANDKHVLSEIKGKWMGDTPEGVLKAHVGPMASGASVIADYDTAGEIVSQNRELLAIEMEAYAVMAAAEYTDSPQPTAIIIKSVCDFADPKKNDKWQQFASYTSAAFADQLFRNNDISFVR